MKNNITFSLSLLALSCLQANAAPTTTALPSAVTAAGTDYTAHVGQSYINLGDALDSMSMADMLLCIVTAGGAPLLSTETYRAVADFGLCGASDENQTTYSSMIVESSRDSDSDDAPQNIKMWIDYKLNAASPVMDIHMKAQIEAEKTAAAHLGVWQIDWAADPISGATDKENGHTKAVVGAAGFSEFTFASESKMPAQEEERIFAKTQMTSSTDGIGRVTKLYPTTSHPADNWVLAFNDSLLRIKAGTAEDTCQDLTALTDNVYDYNLYNSSGALVDIKAELDFTTEGDSTGIIGSYKYFDSIERTAYWVWIDGGDYPTSRTPTTVSTTTVSTTVSDSDTPTTKYTITWDVTVNEAGVVTHAVTAVADGLTSVGSGGSAHVFDLPIIFDTSSAQLGDTISPLTDRNDSTDTLTTADFNDTSMLYNGRGRLSGIRRDSSTDVPLASFADGTALVSKDSIDNDSDHRGRTYYVKAVSVARNPATAADCSVLSGPMVTAAALGLPTEVDITNHSPVMGTQPTVTAEPRIKDGVLITD